MSDTIITQIRDEAITQGLRLHRAAPRGADRLTLEFRDRDGSVVGGQWFREPERAQEVQRGLRRVAHDALVGTLPKTQVVVQRGGVDRRLTALFEVASASGSVLVSHRAERRAVVRLGDGNFAKVLRPGKVPAHSLDARFGSDVPGAVLPEVLELEAHRGVVVTRGLAGPTLHQRLSDTSVPDADVASDCRAIGAMLRAVHDASPTARPGTPWPRGVVHDFASDVAVTERWLMAATEFGLIPDDRWPGLLDHVADRRPGGAQRLVLVHRDLHDKQVILAGGARLGFLDLDLCAPGEPALDLANLLVHLELRMLQGVVTATRWAHCSEELAAGYGDADHGAVARYSALTWLRLAAVYAFRPATDDLVPQLFGAANLGAAASGGAATR